MSLYELLRVLINLGQLIAMVVIPLYVLRKKINLTYQDENTDEDKK